MNDTLEVLAVGTRVAVFPFGYDGHERGVSLKTGVDAFCVGVINAVIIRADKSVSYEIGYYVAGVRHAGCAPAGRRRG